jgi:thioesterase domain-containing protein
MGSMTLGLEEDAVPNHTPIILLRPGNDMPPVFITHGAGGLITELCKVAQLMRSTHPIYGVQARGHDGLRAPNDRVEDMAQYYLDAIIAQQPQGPYFFAGYSFGGLPMLEAAHILTQRGEKIALLALLDTYPHMRFWPLRVRIDARTRRIGHHASALVRLPIHKAVPRIFELSKNLLHQSNAHRGPSPKLRQKTTVESAIPLGVQRVREAANVGYARYRPSYYPGKITFLQSEILTNLPRDAVHVWGKLAREVEVHQIPGDHLGMTTTHAELVADRLSTCLARAFKTD